MKHAVLGIGAVGGLLATALDLIGEDVILVVRENSLAHFPERLTLEQPGRTVTAAARAVSQLGEPVDVLWIATKTYQLTAALPSVNAAPAMVVPLLNGVDHISVLRSHFRPDSVVAGAISVEADRLTRGRFAQRNIVRLTVANEAEPLLGPVLEKMHDKMGFDCRFGEEKTLLWTKLCFLAPFALATAASGKNKGEVYADPEWKAAITHAADEAAAVANADGAQVDRAKIQIILEGSPDSMRSSMLKDLIAGRELELDGIAGPIVRGGEKYGIAVPTTQRLMEMVREREGIKK